MGNINHNVILATTCIEEVATRMEQYLTHVSVPCIKDKTWLNGYRTFVIMPDGGQEDNPPSAGMDGFRNRFIERLREDDYTDGSGSPWVWVEVGYGDYGQKLLRGNNENVAGEKGYA